MSDDDRPMTVDDITALTAQAMATGQLLAMAESFVCARELLDAAVGLAKDHGVPQERIDRILQVTR